MRFMAPESSRIQSADDVSGYYGHLVAHDPHRDSWFSQAVNVVNLWIAVGRVAKDNGLLLYPGHYGQPIETIRGGLPKSFPLEKPLQSALAPGDVLIFHGEHLHSSTLNLTEETRVVLSFRLTVGAPRFAHEGERCRYRRLRFDRQGPSPRLPRTPPNSRGVIETLSRPRGATGRLPMAVDGGLCAARSSKELRYFSSPCPHRGADLRACGYIDHRANAIRCAWHGAAFSLKTGESPCARIGSLKFSDARDGDSARTPGGRGPA
jgi:nitrite reductase/ring-hydroxylating ferredoxin subunit